MLYREQTFAPRAFHSELQQQVNKHSQHDQSTISQHFNTQKSPPWACGKGCAEACAERFSALKTGGVWWVVGPRASQQWHNLSTLRAGHDIRWRRNDWDFGWGRKLLLAFNFIRILNLSASSPTLFLHLPFSQVEAARKRYPTRLHLDFQFPW